GSRSSPRLRHLHPTLAGSGGAPARGPARSARRVDSTQATSGHGAPPDGPPNARTRGPAGAHSRGSVGPNSATVGQPTAAARRVGPESLPTAPPASDRRPARSPSV